ncbi:glycine receptor subunit alpha-2 isoform X1 [Patella vulgata]|uniref:glycine receptor subunit alpha-2 isoform X1 n=1 Tax=Patella vulgata TaxID=6465 RepID=UPI0021802EF0|nr:glycine receptor subunit alpha-2 isoform X1 [Patella vulgata]XP_050416973.1 glycine receptor subunit alpha-2 isoform X1 [Patella vulgata]XP_050416974.1 glycine receptor subunit alpha-2 isoform X1 [Patella vulgata]XP_050416975.1 glycine receptor subunit alpha-2 isoform X1 [Patella vulgata]
MTPIKQVIMLNPFQILLQCSLFISIHHVSLGQDQDIPQNKSLRERTISGLLKGYDANIPPNFEDDIPTNVTVQLYIVSFDSISEATMDYSLTVFLRQSWTDHRLQYTKLPNIRSLELDARLMEQIWVPDLFFTNEKTAAFHHVTVPNRLMHIFPNGTLYYSCRISMTLSCDMDLHKYPFDDQDCHIVMESYGYSTSNLIFKWNSQPIIKRPEVSLPQFDLVTWTWSDCTKTYVNTNYTCLSADFYLNRNYGYYIAQVYIPSVLVVILSWVSFWLDIDAIPARISLGLLTVLTMTTQSSGARANLPRVSYIKAIDVWMAMCLFFVFAALVEFAYVNVMSRVERRRQTIRGEVSSVSIDQEVGNILEEKPNGKFKNKRLSNMTAQNRHRARQMDKISRIAFPGVFIGFNIVYWTTYMLWDGT